MKSSLICLAGKDEVNKDRLISARENGSDIIAVNVDLGNRSYPVYVGSGFLNQPGLLSRHVHGKQALMVTNTKIAPLFLDKAVKALQQENTEIAVEAVILPDGEQFKNMVDSSVGGKTVINYRVGKNMIGAIYQPKCVLVDTDTLNYLPNKELASRIAEAIKCELVNDGKFFEWLENNMLALLAR
ncbi:hypothetical protein BUALT_Bualt10G0084400 [Buddleja alternifolia]|uniref:3-dehydroquinate synthase N-terminal domain-containing protein n=1 Tax=Buddleja alternifolia TaxID=168488 RepID=A0AAV6WX44_9LAMI|nr:hypothetical protein BUALT_Bualt10G0084400 [Buddleja alternifolia]